MGCFRSDYFVVIYIDLHIIWYRNEIDIDHPFFITINLW